MAKAARISHRATKLKLVHDTQSITTNFEAKLEFEQNKRLFLDFKPRNKNQSIFLEAIKENRLTFALGPSGVGKSLCSTIYACEQLESNQIERIVVTRPMVGCDEEMGFLPGTEEEKYIGWVGPILEILESRLGKKKVKTYMNYDKIVLKPLMMMRGSTFRDSIVILDEAQNTTSSQMKMFLTRLGEGSRVIINGDLEQTDLKSNAINGLAQAVSLFKRSKQVKIVEFTENDIVRDPLVREIVKAYRRA